MKRTFILPVAGLIVVAFLFTSCQPSRVWATNNKNSHRAEPPPSHNTYYRSAPLIVSPSPGFRMSQYGNGSFYHRNTQGMLYWKGYDNRFYLDKTYFNKSSYSKWEYKEWKRYSKQSGKR